MARTSGFDPDNFSSTLNGPSKLYERFKMNCVKCGGTKFTATLEREGSEQRALTSSYLPSEIAEAIEEGDGIVLEVDYNDVETEIEVIEVFCTKCQTTVLPVDWEIDDDDVNKQSLSIRLLRKD